MATKSNFNPFMYHENGHQKIPTKSDDPVRALFHNRPPAMSTSDSGPYSSGLVRHQANLLKIPLTDRVLLLGLEFVKALHWIELLKIPLERECHSLRTEGLRRCGRIVLWKDVCPRKVIHTWLTLASGSKSSQTLAVKWNRSSTTQPQ